MLYRFDVTVSREDYYKFSIFNALKSSHGKKQIIALRIIFSVIVLAVALVSFGAGGFSKDALIGVIPYLLIVGLYQAIVIPYMRSAVKGRIAQMHKSGKLLYSPESVMEFYDDCFAEICPDVKSEVKYSAIQCVSVVADAAIYIHQNEAMAYILPAEAFSTDKEWLSFIEFLKTKCANVQYY